VLFLVPLFVVLPRFYGLDGVWMAGPVSDGASALITAVFLFYELAHLKRKQGQEAALGHTESAACPPDREIGGIM